MAVDAIVRRIVTELGAPDLVEALAALAGSDLQSLLLAVGRARADRVTPGALLATAERSALVQPSVVDARRHAAIERAVHDAAPDFEALALSPVAPFAADAVLGGISTNNVLTTTRSTQVVADPTTSMALEAARRRRRDRGAAQRFVTCHRTTRLQPFEGAGFSPHFGLMALVSAGRDEGDHRFELRSLGEHIAVYLRVLQALGGQGYGFAPVTVSVSDTDVVAGLLAASGFEPDELAGEVHAVYPERGAALLAARGVSLPGVVRDPDTELAHLTAAAARTGRARLARVARDVFPRLADAFPDVGFQLDGGRVAGLGYYRGLTLQIWTTAPSGERVPLGDGGFTDWTQRLLSDRKERLLTTGMGAELICKLFNAAP